MARENPHLQDDKQGGSAVVLAGQHGVVSMEAQWPGQPQSLLRRAACGGREKRTTESRTVPAKKCPRAIVNSIDAATEDKLTSCIA